ncbi:MAG: hypothetical protein HFJ94_04725 [Muribaculaceae bacterium]|jgi:hypothetical protein|nr:hypothetical protein [Muribaculaceae bacterium]
MKRSTVIPALLLVYLGVMCYIGRQQFYDGHYLFYFGIIAATLLVIFLLRLTLLKREKDRENNKRS